MLLGRRTARAGDFWARSNLDFGLQGSVIRRRNSPVSRTKVGDGRIWFFAARGRGPGRVRAGLEEGRRRSESDRLHTRGRKVGRLLRRSARLKLAGA